MSITPADLIDPAGSIDLAMFPGKTQAEVEDILTAYIARADVILDARGVTDADTLDAAETLYVYYLAADSVYRRLSLQASSLTFADDGSQSRTQGQIDMWGERAQYYLDQFNILAPIPLPPGVTKDTRSSTVCEPTAVSW